MMEENTEEETPPELAWLLKDKMEPGDPELEKLLDKYGAMAESDEDEDKVRESLTKIFTTDVKVSEAIGFDEKKEASFYVMACNRYEAGKFDEAEAVYAMLYAIYPLRKEYPFGMAAAQQMQGKYLEAIYSYNLVLTIDPDDARAYFHLSRCWREAGKLDGALSCNTLAQIKMENNMSEYGFLEKTLRKEADELAEEMHLDLEAIEKLEGDPLEDIQKVFAMFEGGESSTEKIFEELDRQKKHYLPRKAPKKQGDSE